MTPEHSDTLDALNSAGMLTGRVIFGVITVLLFCHWQSSSYPTLGGGQIP